MRLDAATSFDKIGLPTLLVREYSRLSKEFEHRKTWQEMNEQELWNELCFCILSSNVPFEMAKSAFLQLLAKNLLYLPRIGPGTERQIARELSRPIYLPRAKDGSMRRFRFHALRPRNIVGAWSCLYGSSMTLLQILDCYDSGEEARLFLARTIPGLGMKEASHFLRNIRFSDSLAILDSHILSFLKRTALVNEQFPISLSPRRYMEIEQIMKAVADSCSLSLAVLDMTIWEYMRSN
jgi:N-glycosylase/DNA lyase